MAPTSTNPIPAISQQEIHQPLGLLKSQLKTDSFLSPLSLSEIIPSSGLANMGDQEELKNSPPLEPVVDIQEKDIEDGVSASSAEERDCESLEEGSPITEAYTGCRVKDTLPSEPGSAEMPEFMLHSTKRAIKLFALGLQKLQSKMKSETTKKSSEILMSTADGIYLQLQNLESHIQTDVVKLTSHSKSKRKRFEANFEEQQHELKLIHKKFKEDINRHLQDCRSTLEGLEAHHIVLKGTVEKQSLECRSRDEFMELVWENGQILMRGRSGTTKKGDACTGNSLYPTSNARAESGGNMRSKGARLESVYSTLNGTAFSDPLGRRDSALNPLSELYQLNLEDNTSKRLHPAGSHIFLEPDNFRPRNGSKFVGGIPQLTTSSSSLLEPSSLQFQASAALTRPSQSSIKTPLSMGGYHRSTLPEHESNPDKRTATVNSSYLRSAAHLKPNSQNSSVTQPMSSPVLTRVQELKDRGRNPLESTVIAPACGSKGATGLQNQPGAKLIPPVVAKTKESHNDEVCQTIGKHTSRRQLPGQSSSLVANTPSGKPDIIKLPEPTVSSSSVRSLGASNDPAYSLRRTYEDTEESGYPRQGIRRNVEEPQSIPKQAAPARNATGGKRSRIAEVHSLSERRRRDKINKRMRILKDLIPNCKKVDKASMLDEAIEYLKTLQLQLQRVLGYWLSTFWYLDADHVYEKWCLYASHDVTYSDATYKRTTFDTFLSHGCRDGSMDYTQNISSEIMNIRLQNRRKSKHQVPDGRGTGDSLMVNIHTRMTRVIEFCSIFQNDPKDTGHLTTSNPGPVILDKENTYLQSSGQNERIWNMEVLKYPTKGFAATSKSFTPVTTSQESNFPSHINYDE
ncbi:Transcription factor PIF3 [Morella rubra]|uniref:Transcription factor PIF3 n=1 Tax=Morella rubra TaxID=262757 RepID=A0A6A1WFS5_9ROSI|nr:Transcription factor PIF3 [Morella rubra]